MTQISILGCGWLGLPLAKALLSNGFLVQGSTTSETKLPVLEAAGVTPFLINLSATSPEDKPIQVLENSEDFLRGSSILIIAIPPKLRTNSDVFLTENRKLFVEKITSLLPFIENSEIEKLLFVSSTSVYGEKQEHVSEQTVALPDTESGRQLLEVEQLLLANSKFKTTVLRFGGLIGEDRHPIHFLAGRSGIVNPQAPINLIHQKDCIGIIEKILALDFWNETLNAVAPYHPSREEYYCLKATEMGLALPIFTSEQSSGKIISGLKLEQVLGYEFLEAHL